MQKCRVDGDSFSEVFFFMADRCDKDEMDRIAIIARKIWLRRNEVIHGGLFTHPTQVIREAIKAQGSFKCINTDIVVENGGTIGLQPVTWQAPPSGLYGDAAVDLENEDEWVLVLLSEMLEDI
jgi:hypothetical protein